MSSRADEIANQVCLKVLEKSKFIAYKDLHNVKEETIKAIEPLIVELEALKAAYLNALEIRQSAESKPVAPGMIPSFWRGW